MQGAEQSDYNKYLNELGQYNTDRSFAYNNWLDAYNMINNNLQTASGLEQIDYGRYLNDLNQYNTDRNFDYGQYLDEINHQTQSRQEKLNNALYAAQFGDYRPLNELGINTDNYMAEREFQSQQEAQAFAQAYNLAEFAAQFGDYDKAKALGIDVSKAGGAGNYGKATGSTKSTGSGGARGLGTTNGASGSTGSSSQPNGEDSESSEQNQNIQAIKDALGRDYPNGLLPPEVWDLWTGIFSEEELLAAGFDKDGWTQDEG